MTDKPEALYLAEILENATGPSFTRSEREAIATELRRLHSENIAAVSSFLSSDDERIKLRAQRDELLEALKSTGLFLHHCWCDVQMNDYSFAKLEQQMQSVDAAIAKAEGTAPTPSEQGVENGN